MRRKSNSVKLRVLWSRQEAVVHRQRSQCLFRRMAKIMSTGFEYVAHSGALCNDRTIRAAAADAAAACQSKRSLTRPSRPTTKDTSKQLAPTGPLSRAPAGLIRTRRRRRWSKMVTNLILGWLRRPAECHSGRMTHTKCFGWQLAANKYPRVVNTFRPTREVLNTGTV